MENYRTLPQKSGEAIALLKENYSRFRDGFNEFFPDLQAFVASRL
jgi:hypothetical protein